MKTFGTNTTPFQPANPALDIPDGDPLELKKVTNQAFNNIYGELFNAIKGSGQDLTNVNGTNPDLTQLAQAIGTQSIGGQYYADIGGSTANIKNIMNFSGYPQKIKVGSIISFHNTITTNNSNVTINVYDKLGVLQMSAPLLYKGAPILQAGTSHVWGNNVLSSKTLVTVLRTEIGFELLKTADVNLTQNVITFYTGSNPFTIATVHYECVCSQTDYTYLSLPVTFAGITSVQITPISYTWSNYMRYDLVQYTTSGNTIGFSSFQGASGVAPTLAPSAAGYITVMGYTSLT